MFYVLAAFTRLEPLIAAAIDAAYEHALPPSDCPMAKVLS